MTRLLCRNKVTDYAAWWQIFSSHASAHREAGLLLDHVWRSQDDANDIFFVFEVLDLEKARAFMAAPEAAAAAAESNLVESEYRFVDSLPGY